MNTNGDASDRNSIGWTTSAELHFLESIATKPRVLRGYLEGMRKRVVFGDIDASVSAQRARELLARFSLSAGEGA